MHNLAIDALVQASLENEHERLRLEWVPHSKISDMTSTSIDNVYYASKSYELLILILLMYTPTFVSEFSRIYSLPTHKYKNNDNNFRRYTTWLEYRNGLITGFTEYDNKYY